MVEFRLSPQEDFVFGVRMRGATLSFGPSGSEVTAASLVSTLMLGVGLALALSSSSGSTINGYPVENPAAMPVLGSLTVVYAIGFFVTSVRAGVRADHEGIVLRSLWRRQHIPWGSIAGVHVQETAPQRWSLYVGADFMQWRARPVSSWSVGVVERVDGTSLRLPGFVAAVRDQGLSLGLATATELKMQALARFKAYVTGGSADLPAGPGVIAAPAAAKWTIPAHLAGGLVLWLLVSWAVGTLVSPAFLALGILVSLVRAGQQQRFGCAQNFRDGAASERREPSRTCAPDLGTQIVGRPERRRREGRENPPRSWRSTR